MLLLPDDFAPFFEPIERYVAKVELGLCHMETPMGPGAPTSYPIFNTPPGLAASVARSGWDACSTASNHSLDGAQAGIDGTLDALEAMGERIGAAARGRQTVMLATGHPGALMHPVYRPIARALREAGCEILTPAEGWTYLSDEPWDGPEQRTIRYTDGIAALEFGGSFHHTHHAAPMERMLANLADESRYWPDLVIADHGWAGAAGEACRGGGARRARTRPRTAVPRSVGIRDIGPS